MRHAGVMAELERATAERASRVLLLRAPRGAGRTAVLHEAAQALRERGVPHTLVACEALGGERGAALDAFVRDRLADPAVGGHSPSGGGGSVHPGDEHTSSTAGSSTGSVQPGDEGPAGEGRSASSVVGGARVQPGGERSASAVVGGASVQPGGERSVSSGVSGASVQPAESSGSSAHPERSRGARGSPDGSTSLTVDGGFPLALAGDALSLALEAVLPDAQAREFFAFLLGHPLATAQTAKLDDRARWEGAWGELERWLGQRSTPWVLLLDDAHAADAETLGFVELLARTAQAPALVVLSVRAEELARVEPRLAELRPTGRLTEAALAPLAPEALAQRFPAAAVERAGGNPLLASLLARLPAATPTVEGAISQLVRELPPPQAQLLDALCVAGGRLPGAALDAMLGASQHQVRRADPPIIPSPEPKARTRGEGQGEGSGDDEHPFGAGALLARTDQSTGQGQREADPLPASGWREAADQLAEAGLATVAPTRRSAPGVEVAVRFARLVDERARGVTAEARRAWLAPLRAWAEAEVTAGDAGDRAPWELRAPQVAPLLALAAEAAGDVARASLAWELLSRGPDALAALRRAEAHAAGARKLVLVRRLVEEETFRGEPKQAIATATAAQRTPAAATAVPPGWQARLFDGVADGLERWDQLSLEEASLALEVGRAEAVAALAKAEDTRKAFEALEPKLKKLGGARGGALSMRLARTWCWFAAEILADGPQARRICEAVRARVPTAELTLGFYAPAFLRAEQIAHSRGGDPARARALADELIATAQLRGDVRDECVAWNARSLLHLRDGELEAAKKGFERSLAIARGIGFRRREAIALHNLGLVLCQLGEDEASLASQRQYLAMSEQIGNLVARAYGPAAMAMVHVRRLDAPAAEPLISRARKAAEENGWPGLVAWTRLLSGELKLLLWLGQHDSLLLSQARSDLLACADILEERKANWSEELDPAELFVLLAFAYRFSGNRAQAEAALKSAGRYVGESPVCAAWVAAATEVFAGRKPDAALATLEAGAHRRVLGLWRRLLEEGSLSPGSGRGSG